MEQWERLIEILLDERASDAERDDAAMDLSGYSHEAVIEALAVIIKDDSVDDMIKASCGESLGMIFIQQNRFEEKIYNELKGIAKIEFDGSIRSQKGEWQRYPNKET
ncbi:hypothetical protein [Paenibacillus apis]|uniref:Uncharacterized protein n=1 Tax=Paenibacillus apis TaxID=1792174 RepID=A0A920CLZ2_9BACL|nr:hypothetical protein [Paenibacillus apis]GIO41562.1 hypothetical protein J41TS4_13200 [Paenibacillus apis]